MTASIVQTSSHLSAAAHQVVSPDQVTTAFELAGYSTERSLGVARGIVVRSRSIFGAMAAGFQTLVGGRISIYAELCERTRQEAFELMLKHAATLGGNAVIGVRYDANDLAPGVTEVLVYGTAVYVTRR